MIQHAEYISEKGNYRVVVPDLYRGKTGVDAEEASHVSNTSCILLIASDPTRAVLSARSSLVSLLGMQLADGLDFGQATEDIKQVVDWTKSNGSQKVGLRQLMRPCGQH